MNSKKEQMTCFKKFVKKWNRGELSAEYYDEDAFDARQQAATPRTSYHWNLDSSKPQNNEGDDEVVGPTFEPASLSKVTYAPLPSDATMTVDDQHDYQRQQDKTERKKFQKHQKEVMEDFAPKPSSAHESRVEKSKVRSQQRKEKESDDGYSVNEYDEDDTFKRSLQKEKERKERQMNDKRETFSERLERHREKRRKDSSSIKGNGCCFWISLENRNNITNNNNTNTTTHL